MTAHEEDHARVTGPMSAIGTKRTWAIALQMSAIGVGADKFERRGISPVTDRRCDVVVYAGFGEPI